MRAFSFILLALFATSACSPMVQTRGHVNSPEWQEVIKPGQSTRNEVMLTLGSPSTRSSFGDETWYYITTRRENYAFFKPEITEQNVLAISFDTSGTVIDIKELDKEAMQQVEYTSRETPTEGHSLTFLEQLLGNMGRFNRPEGAGATGIGSNRPGGR